MAANLMLISGNNLVLLLPCAEPTMPMVVDIFVGLKCGIRYFI